MGRPITSRMHAMLDYPLAAVLIASPWIFGFDDEGGAAVAVPVAIGAIALLQSLITDWELSLADIIALPMHLRMDMLAGVVLAASPFVFGFSDEGSEAWIPHVVFGLGLLGAGLMTRRDREDADTRPRHATKPGATHG